MLIALANALQLRQILFLDDAVSQKLKLLHTCTVSWWRQRNTSKGGIAPHGRDDDGRRRGHARVVTTQHNSRRMLANWLPRVAEVRAASI